MTNRPEWDDDGEEEVAIQGDGRSGYSGHSGFDWNSEGFITRNVSNIADQTMYTLNTNGETLNNTTSTMSWNPPPITGSITYDFSTSSWKHTLTAAFNLLVGPWLCILSRLLHKKIGP